jgi:hypothetical protein
MKKSSFYPARRLTLYSRLIINPLLANRIGTGKELLIEHCDFGH